MDLDVRRGNGLLDGRVAIITGAAGGIGRATARVFAREGASLVLVDRDAKAVRAVAEELDAAAVAVSADVTRAADVEAYVRVATDRFGRIDTLFNNAGVEGEVKPTGEASAAAFDNVMAVNVVGVWLNLKYVLRALRRACRGGSIVNTSSGLGLRGLAGMGAYVASKHAVIGLTKTAALEAARDGVRVNAVCPGTIDTPMMQSIDALSGVADSRARTEESIPIGRYGAADEVAEVVLFLASERSSWMTGAAFTVDGGRSA